MQKFYDLAITEGEGLGTAYEYLVKRRLLNKIIPKNRKPRILIAGLPERYGYSLDFISFCEDYNLDYEVIDERADKIDRLKRISKKTHNRLKLAQSCDLCKLGNVYSEKHFDFAFSCEVLQRFSHADRTQYIKILKRIAKNTILFVPNGDNKAHDVCSGLSAIKQRELVGQFNSIYNHRIRDMDYIDMPPWPPGIKRNIFKETMNNSVVNILLNILQIVSVIEPLCPVFIKSRYAHLIYIVA